jgi:hypothetical protein
MRRWGEWAEWMGATESGSRRCAGDGVVAAEWWGERWRQTQTQR